MARPASRGLTERETQLMEILWENGPSTAEIVRAGLPDQPHDSTVRTLLRTLTTKGYVRVSGKQPSVYEAVVARADAQRQAARSLLTMLFGGSLEALIMRLVDDDELSPGQLADLRKSLSRRRRTGDKL
jgi:BlaI family penicillinase repressor